MNNTTRRPLRVFEAFAGIGAQAAALKRMNIDFEIVGMVILDIPKKILKDFAIVPMNGMSLIAVMVSSPPQHH